MGLLRPTSLAGFGLSLTLAAAIGLSGCDNGPSAVQTRDRTADAPLNALSLDGADTAPVAPPDLRPASPEPGPVTANRRESADAKVQRLFARNGAAFGARTPEDYMAKVRAFSARPPADAERVSRPNGDVLLYQASTNTFAVVARNGTPRTMFKPDDGARYWAEQKSRAPTFGQRRQAAE